jgi:ribonucleotide reductase beta subunit family protein with ferritin-like domain
MENTTGLEFDGRVEVTSLYSAVNNFTVPKLEIAEPDHVTHENDPPYEDIEDPKYLGDEYKLAYPPNPKFLTSYNYYLSHVACIWTVNENDPADDYDKFATAPQQFQHIMLATAGCIMIGDSVVLDKLRMNITPVNVRVMMESQIDRENTHQIFYSKWCDVSNNGANYRTLEFRREYMGAFEKMVDKYAQNHQDIQTTLFFIMMCENIMFSPMFLTINYCATLGYAPKICNSNLLVMRDEFIHYSHTRELLASFRRKIKISLARSILNDFVDTTLNVYRKIIGDYDDGTFNFEHVRKHVLHIVHMFMLENSLYVSNEERLAYAKLYGTTPAKAYMSLPKAETKINLMESMSTTYKVKTVSGTVNMDF